MADNITPDPFAAAGPNPADGNPPYSYEQPNAGFPGTNQYQSWQQQAPYPAPQQYERGDTSPQRYGAPLPPAYDNYSYNQEQIPGTTQSGMNVLAIVSLAVALVAGAALNIVAIVCGHLARKQIKETGADGDAIALAGLIIGYIWLAIDVLLVIAMVILVITTAVSGSV